MLIKIFKDFLVIFFAVMIFMALTLLVASAHSSTPTFTPTATKTPFCNETGYWRGEASPGRLVDSSGNGNNLTICLNDPGNPSSPAPVPEGSLWLGGAPFSQPGDRGYCVPHAVYPLVSGPMTIEFWIQTTPDFSVNIAFPWYIDDGVNTEYIQVFVVGGRTLLDENGSVGQSLASTDIGASNQAHLVRFDLGSYGSASTLTSDGVVVATFTRVNQSIVTGSLANTYLSFWNNGGGVYMDAVMIAQGNDCVYPGPQPTPTASPTATPTPTFTITPTWTPTATPTWTPTASPTFTITQTFTITKTSTISPTFSISPTLTATPTITKTATGTPTFTSTLTRTFTTTPMCAAVGITYTSGVNYPMAFKMAMKPFSGGFTGNPKHVYVYAYVNSGSGKIAAAVYTGTTSTCTLLNQSQFYTATTGWNLLPVFIPSGFNGGGNYLYSILASPSVKLDCASGGSDVYYPDHYGQFLRSAQPSAANSTFSIYANICKP